MNTELIGSPGEIQVCQEVLTARARRARVDYPDTSLRYHYFTLVLPRHKPQVLLLQTQVSGIITLHLRYCMHAATCMQ
jgi:hypothetical protein